jgi:hypothetical protein
MRVWHGDRRERGVLAIAAHQYQEPVRRDSILRPDQPADRAERLDRIQAAGGSGKHGTRLATRPGAGETPFKLNVPVVASLQHYLPRQPSLQLARKVIDLEAARWNSPRNQTACVVAGPQQTCIIQIGPRFGDMHGNYCCGTGYSGCVKKNKCIANCSRICWY